MDAPEGEKWYWRLNSDEYGGEEFGPYDGFEQAQQAIMRVQVEAVALADNVDRTYSAPYQKGGPESRRAFVGRLREENGGHWGAHPRYSRQDWGYEASNNDTRLGYWEWVASCIERDGDEDEEEGGDDGNE